MDLKRLSSRAKEFVDKRGGTEALKQDAEQLKEIARGQGSLADKAKAAVSAIKEPGGARPEEAGAQTRSAASAAAPEERVRAQAKVEGEGRGKHRHAGEGRRGHGGGRRGRARAGGDGDAV